MVLGRREPIYGTQIGSRTSNHIHVITPPHFNIYFYSFSYIRNLERGVGELGKSSIRYHPFATSTVGEKLLAHDSTHGLDITSHTSPITTASSSSSITAVSFRFILLIESFGI